MELKIKIKTPKGNAQGIEAKIRNWLLPRGTHPILKTNKDDSEIIWEIETDTRRAFRINRNIAVFDSIIRNMINNRIFKKIGARAVGDKGIKELEDMLINHTQIEIIKK